MRQWVYFFIPSSPPRRERLSGVCTVGRHEGDGGGDDLGVGSIGHFVDPNCALPPCVAAAVF